MRERKILVVSFSRAGENYSVGNIEKGNTQIVAEMIASEIGGDMFSIEPVAVYPEDYDECTEVAKREANAKSRPSICGDVDVESYDVIFVGYPIWWEDMPMPVYTFIESHSWKDKIVVPFCTHEGSGLSGTERKLKDACEGAVVLHGLGIRGKIAQTDQTKAKSEVRTWIEKIKYKLV